MDDDSGLTGELAGPLVEQAPDGIIVSDLDGRIVVWNTAATRIFGHTAAAALGQSLDLIIPEQFRDAHWRGFNQAIERRATRYAGQALATRSAHSDGRVIYVELSFAMVFDAAGEMSAVSCHVRDITERFETERANRRRLRELEAQLAGDQS